MDMRSAFPRFSPENIAANTPIVDLLRGMAEKKNATAAQISLAWLLAQNPWIVPIPGTRNINHLNENLGAINVRLTPADLREIETALSKIRVHGGRMNEEQMKVVGVLRAPACHAGGCGFESRRSQFSARGLFGNMRQGPVHQDKRRFLSDAWASPPPIFGLMTNSSTVTPKSST